MLKLRQIVMTGLILAFFIHIPEAVFAENNLYLTDNFEYLNSDTWECSNNVDRYIQISAADESGDDVLDFAVGLDGIPSMEQEKYTGNASIVTKINMDSEYTASFKMKFTGYDFHEEASPVEYGGFYLKKGDVEYKIQWHRNPMMFSLLKDGKAVTSANSDKLPGYQHYGWNDYKINVTSLGVEFYINNILALDYKGDEIAAKGGGFGFWVSTSWAKYAHLYVKDLVIGTEGNFDADITSFEENALWTMYGDEFDSRIPPEDFWSAGENTLAATNIERDKLYFEDNFESVNTTDWSIYRNIERYINVVPAVVNGIRALDFSVGEDGIPSQEEEKNTGVANVLTRFNMDSEYTASFKMKFTERTETSSPIEYGGFYLKKGVATEYKLQWNRNNKELTLLKNSQVLAAADGAALKGYSQFDWNEYRFNITSAGIEIYINDVLAIDCADTIASEIRGDFGFWISTSWAKYAHMYVSDVVVGEKNSSSSDGNYVLNVSSKDAACESGVFVGDFGWKNYVAEYRAKIQGDIPEYIAFLSRYTNSAQGYNVVFSSENNSFILVKGDFQNPLNHIEERSISTIENFDLYGWNDYRFVVYNDRIKAYLNGAELFNWYDISGNCKNGKSGIMMKASAGRKSFLLIDSCNFYSVQPSSITIMPEYECNISENGEAAVTARLMIPNSYENSNLNLIAAIYDSDNLVSVDTQNLSVSKSGLTSKIYFNLKVEDVFKSYKLKLFLWKYIENLIPICAVDEKIIDGIAGDFEEEAAAKLLYQNNFEGEEALELITEIASSYEPAGYEISKMNMDSVLTLKGGFSEGGSFRKLGVLIDLDLEEYILQADVRQHRFISETASILLNYKSEDDYYALTWTQGKLPGGWEEITDQRLKLCKNDLTAAVNPSAEYIMGEEEPFIWQTYRIYVNKDEITVYLKGKDTPVLRYRNEGALSGGKIGFGISGSGYASVESYIDNIKIWAY